MADAFSRWLSMCQGMKKTKLPSTTSILPASLFTCLTAVCLSSIFITMGETTARADPLQDYAQQCLAAIGPISDFDCDAGAEVPVTHPNGSSCDKPNRLNQQCDPGSRFQVLTASATNYTVAHCRKKGEPAGDYGDIAIIQYNRQSGATCFYQALGNLPGKVAAPSKGMSAWPWISPSGTAGIGCGGCHDNGAFIRSPYISQVTGPNALPGGNDFSFNSTQPYAFVGQDFASWKAYKVEVANNECNGCHRLGVNNVRPGMGTALDFGIRATAASETAKNPPSGASPIWMPPVPPQIAFSQTHANAAKAIHDCAQHVQDPTLPNSAACKITLFAKAYVNNPLPDSGSIWHYTGTPCNGNACPGWSMLDANPESEVIAAADSNLYQLHVSGRIWKSTGAPCTNNACPGWQMLDNNSASVELAAGAGNLYQRHNTGKIWKYTNTPCVAKSCPGWEMLDNNAATITLEASGNDLYQLHNSGRIWKYTNTPCNGNSCPGWQMLDNNSATVAIASSDGNLYQLHSTGRIWKYTNTPCNGDSCPGWQMLDNNGATLAIVAGGNSLYQLHNTGKIWRYTGTACAGNNCPGWQILDNNSATMDIVADGGALYQLHNTGKIWRFTGTACTGNSCPGWQMLDNNGHTGRIVAGGGQLYQIHQTRKPLLRNRICQDCRF